MTLTEARSYSEPYLHPSDLPCPPRWSTRRSPDRATLGPRLAAVAEAMGKPLMPHQRYIADVALEIDNDTGLPAYDEVTFVGPRQVSGKTELLLPTMAHRCTGFGPDLTDWIAAELGIRHPPPGAQRVVYTAQTADEARKRWRDVHVERIKESGMAELVADVRLRLNAEQILWTTGASWLPISTTGKTAATGDTIDLGVIDEAWSRPDNRTELGMSPAMATRDWAQLWQVSMVPGISRAQPDAWPYLKQKMQTGRARVEADLRRGRAYFEWAAPLDADPGSRDTWWGCMPGLAGGTTNEARIRSLFEKAVEAGNLVDFEAEMLGWWPSGNLPQWGVISKATWSGLQVPQFPEPWVPPVALGLDATTELTSASIGMAALQPDGDQFVELVERGSGVRWVVDAVVSICKRADPVVCAVGIDRNGPLAGLIRPLKRAFVDHDVDVELVEMNSGEVAAACTQFYNLTGEIDDDRRRTEDDDPPTLRRVHHIGQPELDAAVGGVTRYYFGDRWRFARLGPSVDVAPLLSVAVAAAAGEQVEWIGGAYDLAESLG
jgi:Terminase large subunit, T4likevirus-type, N-terminal